jgi:catechol 2,3-dioxygenase-like lactoylglutathione lyase family enzyme
VRLRVARHTTRLDELVRFYRDGLGLREAGRFDAHEGYDGVFLAVPGTNAHLEFTSGGQHAPPAPPERMRVAGASAIGDFFGSVPQDGRLNEIRLVPTSTNRQPALAAYARGDDGKHHPYGLMVLKIDGERIAGIVGFPDPWLFERCGLPSELAQAALDIPPLHACHSGRAPLLVGCAAINYNASPNTRAGHQAPDRGRVSGFCGGVHLNERTRGGVERVGVR